VESNGVQRHQDQPDKKNDVQCYYENLIPGFLIGYVPDALSEQTGVVPEQPQRYGDVE